MDPGVAEIALVGDFLLRCGKHGRELDLPLIDHLARLEKRIVLVTKGFRVTPAIFFVELMKVRVRPPKGDL